MWGTVLLLALMGIVDPLRLGIAAALVSRPRPMLNLVLYWLGGMTMGLTAALVLLVLLRDFGARVVEYVASVAANDIVQQIQIAVGVLLLLLAAVISINVSARQRARVVTAGGGSSARVEQERKQDAPTAYSWLSARISAAPEGALLLVAFLAGLGMATPPLYPVAVGVILASEAATGTQIGAALLFTVVTFVLVEIPLVGYLATPAKTQLIMLQLHDWVRAHGRPISAVLLATMGLFLVATAIGSA